MIYSECLAAIIEEFEARMMARRYKGLSRKDGGQDRDRSGTKRSRK
jgi:hypothetical protein